MLKYEDSGNEECILTEESSFITVQYRELISLKVINVTFENSFLNSYGIAIMRK